MAAPGDFALVVGLLYSIDHAINVGSRTAPDRDEDDSDNEDHGSASDDKDLAWYSDKRITEMIRRQLEKHLDTIKKLTPQLIAIEKQRGDAPKA